MARAHRSPYSISSGFVGGVISLGSSNRTSPTWRASRIAARRLIESPVWSPRSRREIVVWSTPDLNSSVACDHRASERARIRAQEDPTAMCPARSGLCSDWHRFPGTANGQPGGGRSPPGFVCHRPRGDDFRSQPRNPPTGFRGLTPLRGGTYPRPHGRDAPPRDGVRCAATRWRRHPPGWLTSQSGWSS